MTSTLLPLSITAASGAAGAISAGVMGASFIAGGLVAAVPVALVVIVDKALDHFCSDLSKTTTGLLKKGSWFVILAVTGAVGSLVLGPLGALFAIPCFIMIAILLVKEIRDLRNELAQIKKSNANKAEKSINDTLARTLETFEHPKRLFKELEKIVSESPSVQLKEAVSAKIESIKTTMNEVQEILDTLKQMDGENFDKVHEKSFLVQEKISIIHSSLLEESFIKLLAEHGIHFTKEEEKEPLPSLV